ncbi:MAG: hypothetical protein D3914_11410 [Candidatus Electrothrix sp. LOE2]|nr:hypothetical protein [Candidatus Electrothrix sp. LOE2]
MTDDFSKRYGYRNIEEAEITIREDAPQEFRAFLIQLLYEVGFTPRRLREIFCLVLRKAPDQSNWSEYPNIDGEVKWLLRDCKWFKVYDILEKILQTEHFFNREKFIAEVNSFFIEEGYGWKINQSLIEMRGDKSFEVVVKSAIDKLTKEQYSTANKELHQALKDLSRRPVPDITGAIQHSMVSLECIAREITGDRKATLGAIMSNNKGRIPPPLDQAVEKAWGFASEYGRHIREGREPSFQDAELIVGICASVGSYLLSLNKGSNCTTKQEEFPF